MADLSIIYNSESGKLIKKHIENKILELDSLSDIDTGFTIEGIGVQTLARIEAIKILKSILFDGEITVDSKNLEENRNKKYGL